MIDRLKQAMRWRYDNYKQPVRRYLSEVKLAVIRPLREYKQETPIIKHCSREDPVDFLEWPRGRGSPF